jgi:hypothetical protein
MHIRHYCNAALCCCRPLGFLQCLVSDVLNHTPCTPFTYSFEKGGNTITKEVLLDENDPVWRNLRYEDMASVIDTVETGVATCQARFNARQEQLDSRDVKNLRELMAAIASDEKLVTEKFTQHYRMKKSIAEEFERRNLGELVSLEQMLVTGVDEQGNKVAAKEIERMLREKVADSRLRFVRSNVTRWSMNSLDSSASMQRHPSWKQTMTSFSCCAVPLIRRVC